MKILHWLLHTFCRLWPLERGRDFITRHTFAGSFGRYLAAFGPWISVREGWRMKTNMGHDYTALSLKLYGELEPVTARFLLTHMKPDGLFLDIGANAGYFSLLVARHFPQARVVAFEPNPPIADLLAASIEDNHLEEWISLYRLAVSDKAATLQFSVDPANSGHSRLSQQPDLDTISVEAVTLDAWLPSRQADRPISLVKIDVEGAEHGVLRGMRQLLLTHRPPLVVEGYDNHLREFGDSLPALRQWLANLGYREVRPWDGNLYLLHSAN